MVLGLEHSDQGEGHAGKQNRGKHGPSQRNCQGRSLWVLIVGKEGHQRLGKGHPRQGKNAGEQGDDGNKATREAVGLLLSLLFQILAEHRDKASGDSRGEYRVKEYPWDAAGSIEGVGLHTHTVMHGQQVVPVQSHHFSQQSDGHDGADRPCGAVPILQGFFLRSLRNISTTDLLYTKNIPFSTI